MIGALGTTGRAIGIALVRDGRGWILLFVATGWVLSLGTRYVFPVLFPYLRDAFGLSLATLGLCYTLLWIAYAVGQFPSGILADRLGERTVLALSMLLSAGTVLAVGLATNAILLAGGMILFGFATALYGPTRFAVLTDLYPKYDSTAIGLTQAAGSLGNTLIPVIAGSLAVYTTWRAGFLYLLPFFFLTGFGLLTVLPARSTSTSSARGGISSESTRHVFAAVQTARTLTLTGILATTMFIIQGVSSFYPIYLIDVKGLTPGQSTTVFGLYFVCAAVVQVLSGALSDIYGPRIVLAGTTAVQIPVLLSLPLTSSLGQIILATVLLSSLYSATPVATQQLTTSLPVAITGTGLGLLRTGYFLIAALGSVFIGTVADYGLFEEAFLALLVPATAALLLSLSLSHSRQS